MYRSGKSLYERIRRYRRADFMVPARFLARRCRVRRNTVANEYRSAGGS